MTRRALGVIDSETDPFKKGRTDIRPFLWGFYDGSQYHEFERTEDLIAFVSEFDGIVYAHNGGKFDFHFLLSYLEAYDDIMIINGRIARAYIGVCELRDSFNILPVPLSEYKKDEIDYSIMEEGERRKPGNWRKIQKYLRSDCVYLWDLVTGFVDRFGLHLTQAGASMKLWQKMAKREAPETDKEFYDQLAPYYYGGRVECFAEGIIERPFKVYDINSAYPFAMLSKHPISKDCYFGERYVKSADFYKVRCESVGAFPFRGLTIDDESYGLAFPRDGAPRTFTITRHEYEAAGDAGQLRGAKVLGAWSFVEHIDFADYILHFWEVRQAAKARGDVAESLFAKLLMNSLYGKFAAHPESYKEYQLFPPSAMVSLRAAGWEFGGELGPWLLGQADLPDHKRRYYNLATAASITGYVRAMLIRALHGAKGVLYCDTDSIAVRRPGEGVALGDGLGQWKFEGDFDRAGIAGKKMYIFRGVPGSDKATGGRAYKMASKGVRLTKSQLWAVAAGKSIDYTALAPMFTVHKEPSVLARTIVKTAKIAKAA